MALSPIAPALVSLLLTGVIGQSQHAAEVISGNIYFEFAATSKKDLCKQFPILDILDDKNFFCGDPSSAARIPDDVQDHSDPSHPFGALSDRAAKNEDVSDRVVQNALKTFFGANEAQVQHLSSPIPFIHTDQSLRIMGQIARYTRQQLSSDSEDTHKVQSCCMPILLSGDTGTGKTYLLFKYLELLRSSGALNHLSDRASIFTLSAKFLRRNVEKLGKTVKESMSEAHGHLSSDIPRTPCSFILDEVLSHTTQSLLTFLAFLAPLPLACAFVSMLLDFSHIYTDIH